MMSDSVSRPIDSRTVVELMPASASCVGGQVAVRHGGRVRDEAARVADVGDEPHDLQARDELLDEPEVLVGVAGRVQVEREHRARRRAAGRCAPPRARGSTRGRGGGHGRRPGAARGSARPRARSRCGGRRAGRGSRVPCSSWNALKADSDGPRSCTYFVLTSAMYGRARSRRSARPGFRRERGDTARSAAASAAGRRRSRTCRGRRRRRRATCRGRRGTSWRSARRCRRRRPSRAAGTASRRCCR